MSRQVRTNQLDGEAKASRKVLDALVVVMPSLGSAVPMAAGPSTAGAAGAAARLAKTT